MIKRCCFAGHSKIHIPDNIYSKLIETIEKLIIDENVSEFMVGNYGKFDRVSARAARNLKKKYPHIQLNLVIPYLTTDINDYKEIYEKDYDNILIADMPENTPPKFRILKCNQYMVQSSQFMIAYILFNQGGAAKTLEYAKKQNHIKIYNIADEQL